MYGSGDFVFQACSIVFWYCRIKKGGRQNPNVMASNTPLIVARYKKFKEKVFYIFVISEIDY